MNFESLTANEQNRITSAGVELMAAITESFGPEEGIKIWDDLSTMFGQDIKYAVFTAMLTGQGSGTVTFPAQRGAYKSSGKFVEIIKLVRMYTGYGLKEAKDFCDDLDLGASKSLKIEAKMKPEFVRSLRNLGITAT